MGTYYNYPAGQMVHDKPEWQIREGYIDQDNNTVYLYAQTSHLTIVDGSRITICM